MELDQYHFKRVVWDEELIWSDAWDPSLERPRTFEEGLLKLNSEQGASIYVFHDALSFFRRCTRMCVKIEFRFISLHILCSLLNLKNDATVQKIITSLQVGTPKIDLGEFRLALVNLLERLQREDLREISRLEHRVIPVVAAMEVQGLPFLREQWSERLLAIQEELSDALTALATFLKLDIRSPQETLFDDFLGEADSKTELNERKNELFFRASQTLGQEVKSWSQLCDEGRSEALSQKIASIRANEKMVSTYGERFLDFADATRLFGHFDPLGTSTGRFSSSQTNLQNLPKRPDFRDCIRVAKGKILLSADYGACELRILAELSKEPVFLDSFQKKQDLHARVASMLFEHEVTRESHPELRARAKAMNFGLLYGMGAKALAASMGVDAKHAYTLKQSYELRFLRVTSFLREQEEAARRLGYAKSIMGRRYWFSRDELKTWAGGQKRIARNMPIQGSGADMLKLAMVSLHAELKAFDGAALVNTIHDELVVECKEDDRASITTLLESSMLNAHHAICPNVPGEVVVEAAQSWKAT